MIAERALRLSEARTAIAVPGSVRVGRTQWDQVDAEWAGALAEQFAHLRSDYR